MAKASLGSLSRTKKTAKGGTAVPVKKQLPSSSAGAKVDNRPVKKPMKKAPSSTTRTSNRASTLPKDLAKAEPLKLPRVLKNLKVRALKVPGYGLMQVCTHIARLDIDSGLTGTHGWQVKLPKHPTINTRFFSDNAPTKRGAQTPSAQRSLKKAVEFLAEHLPECGD